MRAQARRQKLAAAIAGGSTVAEAARRVGLTRTHASRVVNSPETRLVMAELLRRHRRKVEQLVGKALTRIGEALDAHVTEVVVDGVEKEKDGTETSETRTYKTVLAGVDHYARMNGARRLLDMVQAAHGEQVREKVTVTWESFLELYREAQG